MFNMVSIQAGIIQHLKKKKKKKKNYVSKAQHKNTKTEKEQYMYGMSILCLPLKNL